MGFRGLGANHIKTFNHTKFMGLQESFQSVAHEIGMKEVTAVFFPYPELKHTWRFDGRQWEFKVSDYLESAPTEVVDSLAWHLLSRASSMKCPGRLESCYVAYVRSTELWGRARSRYFARAKALSFEPMGRSRDLHVVFDYVNTTYFRGRLREPTLAWTSESPRRRLGYYFEQLDLLAINRSLDCEHVPRYVLEFVMYHELLHHKDREGNCRRKVRHTKAFRERERAFSSYSEAESWLRRIVVKDLRSRK